MEKGKGEGKAGNIAPRSFLKVGAYGPDLTILCFFPFDLI